MKLNNLKKQAGLTLIEVTLVIAVLLGLISVLFIGVSAYREGSNRSKCILNISSVQKAVRSYQNLYDLTAGNALVKATLIPTTGGGMLEVEPTCPSGGVYAWGETVPAVGTTYISCSYADSHDHKPKGGTSGW